ncbi:hypothetical protein TNCV_3290491 [Trichonephila clavipes]|nr:hypothetical protein TNCV_3290491 [Trichonephila clavipes]
MDTVSEYRICKRKPGQDCPRATTAIEVCHLSIIARRNRAQFPFELYAAKRARASRVTISIRLPERERESCACKKTCCVNSSQLYEQEGLFKMV